MRIPYALGEFTVYGGWIDGCVLVANLNISKLIIQVADHSID